MFKTDTLLKIMEAGADMVIDCTGRAGADVLRIVDHAAAHGRRVTLTNLSGRPVEHLIQIAERSRGFVTLDFSR